MPPKATELCKTHSFSLFLPDRDTWSGTSLQAQPRKQEWCHRGRLAVQVLPHSPGLSPVESRCWGKEHSSPNLSVKDRESEAQQLWSTQVNAKTWPHGGNVRHSVCLRIKLILLSKSICGCYIMELFYVRAYKRRASLQICLKPGKNFSTLKITLYHAPNGYTEPWFTRSQL